MSYKLKAGLALLVILGGSLVGCNTKQDQVIESPNQENQLQQDQVGEQKLEYSNLVDIQTQELIKNEMIKAGVSEESTQTFLGWVNDYNNRVENKKVFKEGFNTVEARQVDYDDISVATKYLEGDKVQMDGNCRITTFLLFDDFVNIAEYTKEPDNYLMFDMEAINSYPVYEMIKASSGKFIGLFDPVAVDKGSDFNRQSEQIKEEWEKRGITFKENQKLSLITLFLHDNVEDKRFVGHVGVLIETEEGLMFVEKYSSDFPFQVTKFSKEQELVDYILSRQDIYADGTEVKPIIMKNDKIIN